MISRILKANTYFTLDSKYYDIVKFVIESNHRMLDKRHCEINIW